MKVKTPLSLFALAISTSLMSGCVAPYVAASAVGAESAGVAGNSISVGQQIDDAMIKSKINGYLIKMPQLTEGKSNISITVFNGIVLLLGQVPEESLKQQIATAVSEMDGVQVVYDQLTVGPPTGYRVYASDTWISTKVKANMLGNVNPLHFDVITENSIVYLLGHVTKAEGDEAAHIASQTSGVKQVVKVYEIVKPQQQPQAATEKQAPVKETAPTVPGKATQPAAPEATPRASSQYNGSSNAGEYSVGSNASD